MKPTHFFFACLPGALEIALLLFMILIPAPHNCLDCGMARGILGTGVMALLVCVGLVAAFLVRSHRTVILAVNILPALLGFLIAFISEEVQNPKREIPVLATGLQNTSKLFFCTNKNIFAALTINEAWTSIRFPENAWATMDVCSMTEASAYCTRFNALGDQAQKAGLDKDECALHIATDKTGNISLALTRPFSAGVVAQVAQESATHESNNFEAWCK